MAFQPALLDLPSTTLSLGPFLSAQVVDSLSVLCNVQLYTFPQCLLQLLLCLFNV